MMTRMRSYLRNRIRKIQLEFSFFRPGKSLLSIYKYIYITSYKMVIHKCNMKVYFKNF